MNVNQELSRLSLYDFDGDLNNVILMLQRIREDYPDKKIKLDLTTSRYDDDKEYAVVWERPENEEEIAKRLEDEAKRKEYRRAEFERLKKEFGEGEQTNQ